ncbi:hypothetical protein SESBI_40914 [Sesbania bispinosa]|nr:hypothetical protein SESBI_40914 [Sesbania bispinosa]
MSLLKSDFSSRGTAAKSRVPISSLFPPPSSCCITVCISEGLHCFGLAGHFIRGRQWRPPLFLFFPTLSPPVTLLRLAEKGLHEKRDFIAKLLISPSIGSQ